MRIRTGVRTGRPTSSVGTVQRIGNVGNERNKFTGIYNPIKTNVTPVDIHVTDRGDMSQKIAQHIVALTEMVMLNDESQYYAAKLNELAEAGEFNPKDSRTLDRLISTIMSSALETVLENRTVYSKMLETITSTAVAKRQSSIVDKWTGVGGAGSSEVTLVSQAIAKFKIFLEDNGMNKLLDISKFKKVYNDFVSKYKEFSDVLLSDAWKEFNK